MEDQDSSTTPSKLPIQFNILVQYQPCKIHMIYNVKKLERKNGIVKILQNKDNPSEKAINLVLPKMQARKSFFASLSNEEEEDMEIEFIGNELKETEWEEQVVIKKKTISSTTFKVRCSEHKNIRGAIEIVLPSPENLIGLKNYLEQCGCKISSTEDTKKQNKPFASASGYKMPEEWNNTKVMEWLSYMMDENRIPLNEKYAAEFKGVTGKQLMRLTTDIPSCITEAFGVTDEEDATQIWRELRELKQSGAFYIQRKRAGFKFKSVENENFKSNIKNFMQLQSEEDLGDKEKIKQIMLRHINENQLKLMIREQRKELNDDESGVLDFDDVPPQVQDWKLGEDLPIKLVITDMVQEEQQKKVRRLVSPILSVLPSSLSPTFGIFHPALVVGNWYLEWSDLNLCIPRRIYSDKALIVTDIAAFVGETKYTNEVIDRLAEVIAYWNANMTYSNYLRTETSGNCQSFVEDCLNALGMNLEFKGELRNYLLKMRTKGTCDMEYEIDAELRQKCNLTEKVKRFSTHLELDEFVMQIQASFPTFRFQRPHDWTLLKSFDRAFWLRHFKQKKNGTKNPNYEPHINCPFGDPVATASIRI